MDLKGPSRTWNVLQWSKRSFKDLKCSSRTWKGFQGSKIFLKDSKSFRVQGHLRGTNLPFFHLFILLKSITVFCNMLALSWHLGNPNLAKFIIIIIIKPNTKLQKSSNYKCWNCCLWLCLFILALTHTHTQISTLEWPKSIIYGITNIFL